MCWLCKMNGWRPRSQVHQPQRCKLSPCDIMSAHGLRHCECCFTTQRPLQSYASLFAQLIVVGVKRERITVTSSRVGMASGFQLLDVAAPMWGCWVSRKEGYTGRAPPPRLVPLPISRVVYSHTPHASRSRCDRTAYESDPSHTPSANDVRPRERGYV